MTSFITVGHNAETAHRIPTLTGAGAKCRNVHGHSFWIEWTFRVDDLDADTAEFGAIKTVLKDWVDTHLDHGFVCHPGDDIGDVLEAAGLKVYRLAGGWPTTEAIAADIADVTRKLLPQLTLTRVHVHEGRTNQASWEAQ
ncbi:6-pyruvoyl trahydropterin synthase family protein [Nocardia transvalensis]|uniref:6-pyruvoyl trahydropterin synthase family protein n=1 Tax=Nocardia transvalensis TaxID=37333 RepID=UPI0018950770|nr:6-carboxytetrahydropterin synthase [Nocardia transvalensis]MBF6332402.1 6-carboxytetrahydropterin synthase [Nocardia transvalensis]